MSTHDGQYYVRSHWRNLPSAATPQWIIIHEQGVHHKLKVLSGLRPIAWSTDLGEAKFLLKRDAKRRVMEMFGTIDWDGTNCIELPNHERVWLVRP